MSGIYIHIPFCKQRCTYCDFYKEVDTRNIDAIVDAIIAEMTIRKDFMPDKNITTIYFGGGTPSLLETAHFERIFRHIYTLFTPEPDCEITLEANPDDLTLPYLECLAALPFNRLSIGIQSFDDAVLRKLNRRHTSQQALEAVQNARKVGFNNISIDLIYALPGQSMEHWQDQLERGLALEPEHISAYGLTYEENTPLWKLKKAGKLKVVSDEVSIQMYDHLLQQISEKCYEAYEISNFCKPGFRSRHNSAYWQFVSYLGLGPSAHSYNGKVRQWNVSSNKIYMEEVARTGNFYEEEVLSSEDIYNDLIIVSLRTRDGISLNRLEQLCGKTLLDYCLSEAGKYLSSGQLVREGDRLFLSPEAIHISNRIIMELMKTD